MTTSQWRDRYAAALMHNFNPPGIVLSHGQGCRVTDVDGREYVDLFSGIAVNSLGHAHPDLVSNLQHQWQTLGHVSNLFASPGQIELAERLNEMVTRLQPDVGARVYFANSGTEANEAAFKITRLTGRTRLIAMEGSFHGRTMGALAVTATESYRSPFEPLPGDVTFVPFGDLDALEQSLAAADAEGDPVAAVVVEPIQGENGVIVPPPGFLAGVRELTHRHGALLWVDEIQTGIGRCGDWLASHRDGVTADLVTLAKGLGGGFPIGACVATGDAAELFAPGHHGTTFGGNPVAAAAALTVLQVIERDGLLEAAQDRGDQLTQGILALDHPAITEVRGAGLLRAVQLDRDRAPAVVAAAADRGYLLNAPRPSVLRLAPALIISPAEIDAFLADLPTILENGIGA